MVKLENVEHVCDDLPDIQRVLLVYFTWVQVKVCQEDILLFCD